jgi:hypothetical protein
MSTRTGTARPLESVAEVGEEHGWLGRWPLRGLRSEGLSHRHRLLLPAQAVHRQLRSHRPLQGEPIPQPVGLV